MNDQSTGSATVRESLGPQGGWRRWLVLTLACCILAWAGWRIWNDATASVGSQRFRDTLRQLQSAEPAERWRAAGTLQFVNALNEVEPAYTALTHALTDNDVEVKIVAARSLGTLIAQMKYLPDGTTVPPERAQKLTDGAIRTLVHSLSDANPAIRAAAAAGLGRLARQVPLESTGGGSLRGAGPEPKGARPKRLTWRPPAELAEALQNGSAKWSRATAQAYYGYSDITPPPELIAALHDDSVEVRIEAARALLDYPLGLDSALPDLLTMMEKDEPSVGKVCAESLKAAWPRAAAVSSLTGPLESSKPDERALAIVLLGRIGPEASSAIPALVRILKEPVDSAKARSDRARMQQDAPCSAARALGQISASDDVIGALADVLKSNLDYRHDAAAQGLAVIGDPARGAAPALVGAYKKWQDSKEQAISGHWMTIALGRIAPHSAADADAVKVLIRALDDPDESIRPQAAQSLGKFGKNAAAAIPKLRALKEKNEKGAGSAASAALNAIEGTSQTDSSASKTS
jgi:HEAT repeat protein